MDQRMARLLQNAQMGGLGGMPQGEQNIPDTAEMTYISSLALLKMLKHGASARPRRRCARSACLVTIARVGRAGVPMEVMGLMLGEFVDEYTGARRADPPGSRVACLRAGHFQAPAHLTLSPRAVRVVDVFAMPQSGTGVSVEAVDPVFQMKMLDMLKQTNR
jgi:26S proteasome regulatory subunit N11